MEWGYMVERRVRIEMECSRIAWSGAVAAIGVVWFAGWKGRSESCGIVWTDLG